MTYKQLPTANICNNNLNRLLIFAVCISVLVSFAAISVAIHCHIRLYETQLVVEDLERILDAEDDRIDPFDYEMEDPSIGLSNEDYINENSEREFEKDNAILTHAGLFPPFMNLRLRRDIEATFPSSGNTNNGKSVEAATESLLVNNLPTTMKKRDSEQDDYTTFQTPNRKIYRKSIDADPNANSEFGPPNTRDRSLCRHNIKHNRQSGRLESMDESTPLKCPKMKMPIAAHYAGYTDHYVPGIHKQYKGNGRLQHFKERYMDWKNADWMERMGMEKYFNMIDGVLTIAEPGLYLIYAQIHYVDVQDTQAFRVYKNDKEIIQCTTMTHTNHSVTKSNSCYTSALEYLMVNDRLMIVDVTRGVHSIFQEGKSFFGMVKLGDGKYK